MQQKAAEGLNILKESPAVSRRIKECIIGAARTSDTREKFAGKLDKQNIGIVFRETDKGRFYGTTCIDRASGIVLNGSRLGKAYSSNAFEELFHNPSADREAIFGKMEAEIQQPNDSQHIRMINSGRSIISKQLKAAVEALNVFETGLENQPMPIEECEDIQQEILARKNKRKKKRKIKL